MSASSKKKLRNEQQAAKMTERQLAEQKEAKKLKLYTIAFITVLVALLVVAIWFGVSNAISNNGTRERNTVAMTVGTHEISNAEMNYYFIDALNSMFSGDNAYLMQMGAIDTSVPLDEQTYIFGDGTQTWADYLMDYATSSLKANYAMIDAAAAEGYTLPERYQASVDAVLESRATEAADNSYPDLESYLKAMYGNGTTVDSYRAYVESSMLAQAYYYHYADTLTFEDAELRALESENYNAYTSYTYNYYYLSASRFRQGGTQNEDGTTTYTDEEKAAAITAAEDAAKTLTGENIDSVEALDSAIAGLSINADTTASSTAYENNLSTNISASEVALWLSSPDRQAGDKVYLPNETTTSDGVTTIDGYYIVYFINADENLRPVNSVRHILAQFEGGVVDSETGLTVYSDEEKAAAKAEADALLAEWQSGEATEESFAALANAKSDDGDGTTGGLYKYVGLNTGYVESFESWAVDESRKSGDVEIVETEYGYHIMYFVGQSGRTYRDVLIENELADAALQTWYAQQVDAMTVTEGDLSYVQTDKVLYAY